MTNKEFALIDTSDESLVADGDSLEEIREHLEELGGFGFDADDEGEGLL